VNGKTLKPCEVGFRHIHLPPDRWCKNKAIANWDFKKTNESDALDLIDQLAESEEKQHHRWFAL